MAEPKGKQMLDVIEIDAPVAPGATEIFQVTLPSGAIMTRAYDFQPNVDVVQIVPVVGENGEVIVAPK
jgi:hypothetical protein